MKNSDSYKQTETKLNRIAWLSKMDANKGFENLMHLFNEESLIGCFQQLERNKAVGLDKVSKDDYAKFLNKNIKKLLYQMKRMAYRPGPVRQTMIPKAGGAMRPLGISSFEDKIIQKMTQKVLESIYEPIFKESSYGFRPNRGCHDAIKALSQYLYKNEIKTVIDVDIKGFFDNINHKLLEGLLRKKIKDERFMRYIIRMFKAGTLSKGELKISVEGVPQGSICSPVLANTFAHYVIDIWLEEMVRPCIKSKIAYFRYCDDLVICCHDNNDAIKIKNALEKRLAKFKLELNKEKTKLISFSRRAFARGVRQGAFDFLGFTFYFGKSRNGYPIAKIKTSKKRYKDKLKNVKTWIKITRNKYPLLLIWEKFKVKLRGHIQYYGVSHNTEAMREFAYAAERILYKWINRRSQRKSFDWDKWNLFVKKYPRISIKIHHKLY
jgi:RNA-directed DNA polymerase